MDYNLVRSKRKTISLSIDDGGGIIVKAPNRMPRYAIEQFIDSKNHWIHTVQSKILTRKTHYPTPNITQKEIQLIKKEFRNDCLLLINELSERMNVSYNRLKITSARSRWGSCSSKQNININWRLALVPIDILVYVLVHELSHLRHMNHSTEFWNHVEKYDPDFKTHRKQLKNYNHYLSEL
jgi:hypothetical protein